MEAVQPPALRQMPTARTPTQPSPIEGEGLASLGGRGQIAGLIGPSARPLTNWST